MVQSFAGHQSFDRALNFFLVRAQWSFSSKIILEEDQTQKFKIKSELPLSKPVGMCAKINNKKH